MAQGLRIISHPVPFSTLSLTLSVAEISATSLCCPLPILYYLSCNIWNVPRDFDPCVFTYSTQLHRYIFQMVRYGLLFSTFHTTLCENIFPCLAHSAEVMKSDILWGSKPPHLQVGAFKWLQIWCVCRGVLWPLIYSVR